MANQKCLPYPWLLHWQVIIITSQTHASKDLKHNIHFKFRPVCHLFSLCRNTVHPSPENCESRCGFIRKEMQREDDESSLRNPSLRPQTVKDFLSFSIWICVITWAFCNCTFGHCKGLRQCVQELTVISPWFHLLLLTLIPQCVSFSHSQDLIFWNQSVFVPRGAKKGVWASWTIDSVPRVCAHIAVAIMAFVKSCFSRQVQLMWTLYFPYDSQRKD